MTINPQKVSWRLILVFLIALNLQTTQCTVPHESDLEVISPTGNIKVSLKVKTSNDTKFGTLFFNVNYVDGIKSTEVITSSQLGISRKDQKFVDNLKFLRVLKEQKVLNEYTLIHGKRKNCRNEATEKTFRFVNSENKILDITFRAYNNGVAFRYNFPGKSDSICVVTDESTIFHIPANTKRWMQPYNIAYEDTFPVNTTGKGPEANQQEWGFPALFNVLNQPYFILISEADISRSNCATRLGNKVDLSNYKIIMPENEISGAFPWASQWRVLMIGNLSDIVESTLVTDVSEPCKLKDTDWIKPGIVSWIYWANNHGSKDYKKVVEYVDLAVAMKWPYVLIDWEWNQMGNGGKIEDALGYAKSKGIKPLMWYNSGDSLSTGGGLGPYGRLLTPEARAKEFTWLNQMGVYGIKVDFFTGDQQKVMNYYIDLMEDAAKYHLMINFHGATVPRGWDRTYPNLMSVEGVYGAEWYNNKPSLTKSAGRHNTTLPFTRNVVGPMDYTPVTFSNSQHPHITSYGHELALSVVFESGIQHFADRPEAYYELSQIPKEFLKAVPTAWDDTKLIVGYPGVKVVIARKRDNRWYVGGINGKDEEQVLKVNFDFLGEGNFNLKLIKDGKDDKSFNIDLVKVKKGDVVNIKCLPRGGFVGTLEIQNN